MEYYFVLALSVWGLKTIHISQYDVIAQKNDSFSPQMFLSANWVNLFRSLHLFLMIFCNQTINDYLEEFISTADKQQKQAIYLFK